METAYARIETALLNQPQQPTTDPCPPTPSASTLFAEDPVHASSQILALIAAGNDIATARRGQERRRTLRLSYGSLSPTRSSPPASTLSGCRHSPRPLSPAGGFTLPTALTGRVARCLMSAEDPAAEADARQQLHDAAARHVQRLCRVLVGTSAWAAAILLTVTHVHGWWAAGAAATGVDGASAGLMFRTLLTGTCS